MNDHFGKLLLGSVSAAAIALLAASPVTAQAPVEPGGAAAQGAPAANPAPATSAADAGAAQATTGVAEIVVTAERRSSSVQRTSIPIEVLSSETIRSAGVTQATDLTRLTAGVQVGATGAAPQVYIRGVGDFGSTAVSNPAVAFNIDGVYVARTQSTTGNFYDVQRVEILKGPQGTLYGRNASGGAINIITNRPNLSGISATMGFDAGNYETLSTDGAINLPLSSTTAVRASYQITHRSGYSSVGLDDDKHQSVRLQALWEPTQAVSLLLSGDYTHVGGRGAAYYLYPKLPGRSAWTDITDPAVRPIFLAGSPFPGAIAGPDAANAGQDMNFYNIHAELNADLGFATLTVLPAYREASMQYTAFPTFEYRVGQYLGPFAPSPETSKAITSEVRLGHDSADLKWVVGGFFYDERQRSDSLVYSGLIQNSYTSAFLRTRSYAAFGQATYAVVPGIRLIAGGRFTYERRRAPRILRQNVFPSLGCLDPAVPVCPAEDLSGARTFRNFSWKGGIEADVAQHSMAYATVSRGFKSGGFSLSATYAPSSTEPSSYRPEILTAYELGLKNRFLDNKLQVNLEAFYWDYKDHQESFVTIDGNAVVGQVFLNAGKARQFGGNIDIVATPTENDTIRLAAEYLDSKYTKFDYQQPAAFIAPGSTGCQLTPTGTISAAGPLINVDCSGYQLTRAPKWTGNASYSHRFDLANGSGIFAQAGITFASARWLAPDFIANERAPSYVAADASLRYQLPGGRASITGFVRNVTKEQIYTGAIQSPFVPGVVAANLSAPRTYGVRAEFSF